MLMQITINCTGSDHDLQWSFKALLGAFFSFWPDLNPIVFRVEELKNSGMEKGRAHLMLSEPSSTCRACLAFSYFCIEGYAYIDANKIHLFWIRSWPRRRNGHKSTRFWGAWAIKRRVWKRAVKVGRSVPCLLNQKMPLCKLRSVTANIIHSHSKILRVNAIIDECTTWSTSSWKKE